MSARVVIAIAMYNDETFVAAALAALCAQSFRSFHVIVLDDGSSDRSVALAAQFKEKLSIEIVPDVHRGRHGAKRAVADRALATGCEYLLVLDSDITLPPEAVERMVGLLDDDSNIAAVSAHARSDASSVVGRGQAFMDDAFLYANTQESGEARWIVGGCAMFRAAILRDTAVRSDLLEDSDLSQKLRTRFRLVTPRDLVARHFGIPRTFRGVYRRGEREGVRVRALVRVYPEARQFGSMMRLLPLPLCAVAVCGAVVLRPWLMAAGLTSVGGYMLAFLAVTRRVPASLETRLWGTLVFTWGNIGFAVGYLRESLRRPSSARFSEPPRAT